MTATVSTFPGFNGTPLAVHHMGEGRPVVMLHGLISDAEMNWIKFGHARLLADAGFRVIMPDLRAHGQSGKPHDPADYPLNVTATDLTMVINALGLTDYDLVGFSLGSRISVLGVTGGLRPRRLVLGGMGLEVLDSWSSRKLFYLDALDRFDTVQKGDPAFMAVSFMKTMDVDRVAMRLLLESFGDTAVKELAAVTMPCAVVFGTEDDTSGDPAKLAAALPDAVHIPVPGTHMSCVTKPDLGIAIRDFLITA